MTLQRRASTELVVPAWINSIPEFSDRVGGLCSTVLPDNSTWGVSGFILASGEIGGGEYHDLPQKNVVVQLDFYAGTTGSGKPLWNVAASLGEAVMVATKDEANLRRTLNITVRGKSFGSARVLEVYPVGALLKDPREQAQWAHYFQDYMFHWVRL